jgi:hypothetical protein
MSFRELLRIATSPPAEVSKADTGLRFTDILFGFVARELFLRLQNWRDLSGFVRWQLIMATVLVLGSWIGFRRSLNRTGYEVKFFNLPFWRFLLDQAMVFLYFYVAVLTSTDPHASVSSTGLLHATATALFVIFGLYLAWDFGGIWMARVKENGTFKYREIDQDKKEPKLVAATPDWRGFLITLVFFVLFGVGYHVVDSVELRGNRAAIAFGVATLLLLLYRFVKEIRTSLKA